MRLSAGGRKAYFLIYRLGDARRRMTLGLCPTLTVEDARRAALEILREVHAGRDPAREKREFRTSPRLAELTQMYVSERLAIRHKPSTRTEYERIFEREIIPRWGELRVSNLTEKMITAVLEEIRARSPIMAERVHSALSSLLRFAQERGVLRENPALLIRRRSHSSIPERVLSDGEIASLWHAESEDRALVGLLRLLILTGQRLTPVLSMRWQEIVFEQWTVNRARNTQVFLHPLALDTLRELRSLDASSEFVFPERFRASFQTRLKRATRALRIQEHWSPQDIRRTVELRLRELRIRPDVIERALGRKTTQGRLKRRLVEYDYGADLKQAFLAWGRSVALIVTKPHEPGRGGSKVIQLFPKGGEEKD